MFKPHVTHWTTVYKLRAYSRWSSLSPALMEYCSGQFSPPKLNVKEVIINTLGKVQTHRKHFYLFKGSWVSRCPSALIIQGRLREARLAINILLQHYTFNIWCGVIWEAQQRCIFTRLRTVSLGKVWTLFTQIKSIQGTNMRRVILWRDSWSRNTVDLKCW